MGPMMDDRGRRVAPRDEPGKRARHRSGRLGVGEIVSGVIYAAVIITVFGWSFYVCGEVGVAPRP